jgi:uncharacterized OB-fold protein
VPLPRPTADDAPFWAACQERRLVFQRCIVCGTWRQPPAPICPACQSQECKWQEAVGEIELYSWTQVWIAGHLSVAKEVPYFVGVFAFRGCGGVRLAARLLGVPNQETPRIGMSCALVWREIEDHYLTPAFEPAPEPHRSV